MSNDESTDNDNRYIAMLLRALSDAADGLSRAGRPLLARKARAVLGHVERGTPLPEWAARYEAPPIEMARQNVIDAAKDFEAHDKTYLISNYENVKEEGERQRLIVRMLVAVNALRAAELGNTAPTPPPS